MRMFSTFSTFNSHRRRSSSAQRPSRTQRTRWSPAVDGLEQRLVLSTVSSIAGNFNGTAVPAGDSLWFTSVAKVQGLGSSPVTVDITNQTISFTANGTAYNVSVPNTVLVMSPTATSATTAYNAGSNTWDTTAPSKIGGNVFLAGVSLPLPNGLPGGIQNVTWQGQFSTDTAGINLNWQWAAAGYSQFSTNPSSLGVKPVDDNQASQYQNSDHAGTPENFKPYVVGGATGGGGSNWTGSLSATAGVTPSVGLPVETASLSGYVTQNGGPVSGVVVTLTGVDDNGNPVNVTATTNAQGLYTFAALLPGTYTVEQPPLPGTDFIQSVAGTDNGNSNGTVESNGDIGTIVLGSGDQATNYDFEGYLVLG